MKYVCIAKCSKHLNCTDTDDNIIQAEEENRNYCPYNYIPTWIVIKQK